MALVNKSLLHRMPTGRYEVHELLRQYAAEKLDQSGVAGETVRDRHCAYFTAALQRWGEDLKGPRQQAALVEMGAEILNARAAWNWAVERGQVEQLNQAIDGLGCFYLRRMRYQEGEAACRMAAEKLAVTVSGNGLRIWAKILTWQSSFNIELGRAELASQVLRQSLALLEEPELADQDTRPEKAHILGEMGWIVFESDREEAKRLHEQSLTLYQALGDRWGSANALSDLGRLADSLGVYGEAKQLLEKSLTIRQVLGDKRGITESLRRLARSVLGQGQLEEAERLIRESSAILRETGDRADIAGGFFSLGWTLLMLGKYAEGHSLLEESLAVRNDLGITKFDSAMGQMDLGFAEVHLGRYEAARARGQVSLTLFQETGSRWGIGFSFWLLGHVALVEGAYAEAQGLLQQSVAVYRKIGEGKQLGVALALLGVATRGLSQLPQAKQRLYEALRTAAETGAFWPLVFVLPAIALLLADEGEKERAVEHFALTSRYPFVANSRWFEDVVGAQIAAVAATLPPEVVAAAQERGKARDLWTTAEELLDELGQT